MKRSRGSFQIIAVVLTLIVVITIVFFLIKAYHYFQKDDIAAYDIFIPETAMVLKCDNLHSVKELYASEAPYVSFLLSSDIQQQLHKFIGYMETLPFMHTIIKSCPAYVSVCNKENKLFYVYVIETTKKYDKEISTFLSVLKKSHKAESFSYKKWEVFRLTLPSKAIYYCYTQGLLIGSFDERTMYASLNQIEHSDKTFSKKLKEVVQTVNENTSFCLMIQHAVLHSFLSKTNTTLIDANMLNYISLCSWSALDISFKNSKIILSGYSLLDSSKKEYAFYTNKQAAFHYKDMLPQDIRSVLVLNGGSYSDFSSLYHVALGSQEDFFAMLQPNSMLSFQLNNKAGAEFILVQSDDIDEAKFHLFNCLNSTYENNSYILDTLYREAYMIGNIDIPNFFLSKLQLAPAIKRLKAYTSMDDCILFSDSDTNLIHYISLLKEEAMIKNDSSFMILDAYFPKQTNFMYYKTIKPLFGPADAFTYLQSTLRAYRMQSAYYDDNKMYFTLVLDPK
ncbi:MAG: hypothetical protein RBS13_05725 [Bacteroidales bacterium]|jgi:hypothetical protein|nr:hypothetical protein [Bacteroidales bacterium]